MENKNLFNLSQRINEEEWVLFAYKALSAAVGKGEAKVIMMQLSAAISQVSISRIALSSLAAQNVVKTVDDARHIASDALHCLEELDQSCVIASHTSSGEVLQ